ncbi:heat shock factor binding protein 1-domain-containing protein, partial [Mycena amicta]
MSSALPLKVTPATPGKLVDADRDNKTPTPSAKTPGPAPKATIGPGDISSPHELTAFVETLLEQLDSKFDEMSTQILDRMNQMSTRVDALEASIQDIINADLSVPQSPSPIP